ncbi:chromate transporter-domain-containing protein [Lipomyces japonicus]|uniref:chromate transporter-domain-containing protein n=1 Tax=Lipomyces japonicus TaxID=56871 RepID=UPI0034CEA59C
MIHECMKNMPSILRFLLTCKKNAASKIGNGIADTLRHTWYLGLTCFGGPPVHFQIFQRLFVDKYAWIDEQMYKEIFSLCQALPGPASTKMLYAINIIHNGLIAGVVSFFVWCLPGAIAAFGLGVGVSKINDTLPAPAYALLSGLNAATVGIIALAAVQLSQKAITDKLTRILVFAAACAGMLYNALWYFPVLMIMAGACTIFWDYRRQLHYATVKLIIRLQKIIACGCSPGDANEEAQVNLDEIELQDLANGESCMPATVSHRLASVKPPSAGGSVTALPVIGHADSDVVIDGTIENDTTRFVPPDLELQVLSWKVGITIICIFFISFIVIMVIRATVPSVPLAFSIFANFYLAGTIIFGGGPVVVPLLREYVVTEGWVSSRDFLLGLAICQAFPGPNFNFAVYLGILAGHNNYNLITGAVLGFFAIFTPGIVLHTGTMGVWKSLRRHRWFVCALRGINASAVGLIFTAVYRLWQQGFLSKTFTSGSSLGLDPWWVVISATAFVGGRWFNLAAPVAIVLGGTMGMVWYGVNS